MTVRSFFLLLLVFLGTHGALAAEQVDLAVQFDFKAANKTLSQFEKSLHKKTKTLENLNIATRKLTDLELKTEKCISVTKGQLSNIKGLLKDIDTYTEQARKSKNYQYLAKKLGAYGHVLADCRILQYKVHELNTNYKEAIRELSLSNTLQRTTPIWRLFDISIFSELNIKPKELYDISGLNQLTLDMIIMIVVSLLLSIFIGLYLHVVGVKYLRKRAKASATSDHIVRVIEQYIPLILPLATLVFTLNIALFGVIPQPGIIPLSEAALGFTIAIFLVDFFMFMPTLKEHPYWTRVLRLKVAHRFKLTLIILAIGAFALIISEDHSVSLVISELGRTVYITIMSLVILWLSWVVFDFPFFKERKGELLGVLMKTFLTSLFLFMIISEWIGYHYLSIYTIKSLMFTLMLIVLFLSLGSLIENGFAYLRNPKNTFTHNMYSFLGVRTGRTLPEMVVLRVALYIIMSLAATVALLEIWEITALHHDMVRKAIWRGFNFFNFTVYPIQIVIAMFTFTLISILGRAWSQTVARMRGGGREANTQVAIASIMNYIFFSAAFVIALLIAGVNFTGLIIIAGALSVGIGFGLQNIVNNFICGVILLLQRPVKNGDRVIVGETEGFITKVRILSTQVHTEAQDDIIIPNSDLIFKPITNYMFRDQYWRIECRVGVSYKSDTDQVIEVLSHVADSHPLVLKEPPNAPRVLFREIGESALIFELWVIISDVNCKNNVGSDLNYAIEKALRENDIEIAYPQRDVHVRSFPARLLES